MLKHLLVFLVFLALSTWACLRSQALLVSFYVIFPTLSFPVLYFYDNSSDRRWFFASAFIAVGLYLFYLVRLWSPEAVLFGVILATILGGFVFYRSRWTHYLRLALERRQSALTEFELLKEKHQSRMDSLRHLEKQVASLLDLFEIARDFNECLSLQSIAELLSRRVWPQLPFQTMRLIVVHDTASESLRSLRYTIDSKEAAHDEEPLTEQEQECYQKMKTTRAFHQEGGLWSFPLLQEGALSSWLMVEGAVPEDLAKFEVLASYLSLQVRKINLYETVREISITDELTGVFVRRHFLERFDDEIKRSLKYGLSLAVLMLDIDHFKRYNDEHGHLAGDSVLKQVTGLLLENLRKVDTVARYGGEEFVIVLPESQAQGAFEVAERIRSHVARHRFSILKEETRVTVSIGVAVYPLDIAEHEKNSESADIAFELIQHADKALYRAKEEGRNRVILYKAIRESSS